MMWILLDKYFLLMKLLSLFSRLHLRNRQAWRRTSWCSLQIAVLGINRKGEPHSPFSILLCFFLFFLLSNLFRAKQGSPSSRTWYSISFAGHFGEYVCVAYDSLIIWRVWIFNDYSRRKWIHSNTLSIRHSVTSWTGVGHVEEGTRFPIYF